MISPTTPVKTPRSLGIVVPCYNEEDVLAVTIERLDGILGNLLAMGLVAEESRIYLIDDGSTDTTWQIIEEAAGRHTTVEGLKLSANRGHQKALYAGLATATEEMLVSIDADLQDTPDSIIKMVEACNSGYDIVYGVRSKRTSDTFFKRATAEGFYSVMRLLGVDLVSNHADFRLMSRRAVDAFLTYPESNLFIRGIVREVGFPSTVVYYERNERLAGESKYPLIRMLSFAWDGVTSFSSAPLRFITLLGFLSAMLSLILIFWVLWTWFFSADAVPGWASIMVPLLFIGSVQLLSLGIVGEYIAKIYVEVKSRPRFHLERFTKNE